MFRASLCPSSGAYQLHQQPLVYRRNVVVAVLLVVVGPGGPTTANLLPFAIAECSRDGLTTARCCNYSYMCS